MHQAQTILCLPALMPRAYSGVSVDSFVKKITFQHITPDGIRNIGPTVEILAALEGLQAHKNAVTVRMKS